jgi:hypothetical protein
MGTHSCTLVVWTPTSLMRRVGNVCHPSENHGHYRLCTARVDAANGCLKAHLPVTLSPPGASRRPPSLPLAPAAVDTATDPRAPRLHATVEPEAIQKATGLTALHTTCVSERLVSRRLPVLAVYPSQHTVATSVGSAGLAAWRMSDGPRNIF